MKKQEQEKENNETKDNEKLNEENQKKHNENVEIVKEEKKFTERELELLNTLQRIQAEFDNYRKRVERDREEFTKYASKNIIANILPVIDNFQRSFENKTKENHDAFVKAMEMIYVQLKDILKKEGLEKIESLNKPFNPEHHEPLLQEESDKPENTVIEVLDDGYKLHDKVIRHARVKLAKSKSKDGEDNQNKENKNKNTSNNTDVEI